MRGKFLSILASVLCVGEIAMAAVPLNSIALGGIVPGMTKGDVVSKLPIRQITHFLE